MVSFKVDYWEVVEYGVDEVGCEYEIVVSRNLTEREAKARAIEMMRHPGEYEEQEVVFYMAKKMS